MRVCICLCAILSLLAGCAVIQDVDLITQDISNANGESSEEASIQQLEQLAQQGYVEAELALANVYLSSAQQDDWLKVKNWLDQHRHLDDRTELKYLRWLTSSAIQGRVPFDEAIEALEKRMQSKGDVIVQLIRLLSLSPTENQQKIQQFISSSTSQAESLELVKALNRVDDPSPYIEFIMASCQGEAFYQSPYYCLSSQISFAKLHDGQLLEVLIDRGRQAIEQDLLSTTQIIRLITRLSNRSVGDAYPLFAYRLAKQAIEENDEVFLRYLEYELDEEVALASSDMISRLNELSNRGVKQADLLLGQLFADGRRVAMQPKLALRHLNQSQSLVESKYHLGQLLLSGKLGYVKLQEGIDLLVEAGREGHYSAYRQLFLSFSEGEGIVKNPIYAHVFAGVFGALGYQLPPSQSALIENFTLSDAQKMEVNELIEQELLAGVEQSGTVVTVSHQGSEK